ncbi:hypothetical protein B0J12DRAFT_182894 [Macrophomina phaseolina]|uniref:Uncharacterized protein n=1 Tax=Macrophomina phaseolina TaxID=35725 RepID=A0ABQ8G4L8_9PEZI|nr:hypothetical protein B0J12DRAFT_182894 [Macrophomina phaseolina]
MHVRSGSSRPDASVLIFLVQVLGSGRLLHHNRQRAGERRVHETITPMPAPSHVSFPFLSPLCSVHSARTAAFRFRPGDKHRRSQGAKRTYAPVLTRGPDTQHAREDPGPLAVGRCGALHVRPGGSPGLASPALHYYSFVQGSSAALRTRSESEWREGGCQAMEQQCELRPRCRHLAVGCPGSVLLFPFAFLILDDCFRHLYACASGLFRTEFWTLPRTLARTAAACANACGLLQIRRDGKKGPSSARKTARSFPGL